MNLKTKTAAASLILLAGGVFGIVALTDDNGGEANTFAVQPETSSSTPTDITAPTLSEPTAVDAPFNPGNVFVFPWGESFIALQYVGDDTYLAEDLVEDADFREAFSPDVVELFEEQQPSTFVEAWTNLIDAGLIEEFSQSLNANPQLGEMFDGGEHAPSSFQGRLLGPDQTWTDVDVTLPEVTGDDLHYVRSNGTHLVTVHSSYYQEEDEDQLTVSVTDDLVHWTSAVIPTAVSTDSPNVDHNAHVSEIALGRDRWVAVVRTDPQDNTEQPENSDGEIMAAAEGHEPVRHVYSGTHDGVISGGAETDIGEIVATDDGFLAASETSEGGGPRLFGELLFSSDGSSFAPIEGPPDSISIGVRSIASLGEATLVFLQDGSAYRGDASAKNWVPIELSTGATTDMPDEFRSVAITEVNGEATLSPGHSPQFQLNAIAAGERWLAADLDEDLSNGDGGEFYALIVNGDRALVVELDVSGEQTAYTLVPLA